MAEPPQQMDEILASIRRIIAEEPPSEQLRQAPSTDVDEDVLELGSAPVASAPEQPTASASESLLSGHAAEASRTALAALSGLAIDPNAPDNTMDGLVRELIRPMLKQWLDANLPEIVERHVAREIARLGGR